MDGETNFRGTGIDPNSQAVQNASTVCDKKVGMPDYGNGSGPAGVVQVSDCNAPPGKQCPSGLAGSPGGSGGPIPVSGSGQVSNG